MKNNSKGYTISELLMVVFILSMIVIIISGGINLIKNAYEKITLRTEAQTILSTTIIKVNDEFRFAKNVRPEDNGYYSFESNGQGYRLYLKDAPEPTEGDINALKGILIVPVSEGEQPSQVIQLFSDKAMTSGLIPKLNYSYADGIFTANVSVWHDDKELLSENIKVRQINY